MFCVVCKALNLVQDQADYAHDERKKKKKRQKKGEKEKRSKE